MKKHIYLFIAAVILFTLTACNGTEPHTHHDHTHANEMQSEVTDDVSEAMQEHTENVSATNKEDIQTQTVKQDTDPTTGTDDDIQALTEYPFTVEATGTLMYKHSNKIDIPFEQEYINAKSHKERVSACKEYADEWRTIADRYYKELLFYNGSVPDDPNFATDEEMHTYIEQRKMQWEAEFEENSNNYLASLQQKYGESDKAQALSESYKFDLQREFALELIGVYELLGEFNNQEF